MSNDTTNTPEQPAGPGPFNEQPWQILMGIRTHKEGDAATKFPHGVIIGMAVTPEVMVPTSAGDRPDKLVPAVHFGAWLDRNWAAILRLWEVEYAQYMNLARRSGPVGRPPELALVDPRGERLGSGRTQ